MIRFLKNFWPVLGLLGITILIVLTNYDPGTILSGWDNLHPELSPGLNIRRSIFAVWQEYQGLGLLGGMAHATDLVRQVFLLALSFILPTDVLRYFWTFLMLFIGTTGAYYLIKHFLYQEPGTRSQELVSFLGALFYLLNLATVQMFFVPYEAFSNFFGFLPWLLLTGVNYFKKPHTKNAFILAVTLFLATPSWYVQTFFLVYLITLLILISPIFLKEHNKNAIIKTTKLFLIIFLINSFWLLPAAYFTITNSDVNISSKINQMATENIFLQNKEFGTLQDVALLKGFMFNSVDPDTEGAMNYMLTPWRDHLSNPLILLIGFTIFAIILWGFIKSFKNKNPFLRGFSYLFIFSFIALAIDTPPFSWINTLIRENVNLLNQIFRFPFTKFSTMASLTYAVLFAVGISNIELRSKNYKVWKRISFNSLLLTSCFLLLAIFTAPVFQGHLIYDKEKVVIPQEYRQLFEFFEKQDPTERIANLPQSKFWGWSFYDWEPKDYGGSGFLWYGIEQPIADRAFDVWSSYNENYYFELSNALYSKDVLALERVLNKYQVTWLILDKNIFDPASNRALFIPEIEELLSKSTAFKKEKTFGKLDIYQVNLAETPEKFVFLTKNLPRTNSYKWSNSDKAYADLGNYIATESRNQKTETDYFYPFRSLFSGKSQKEKEFAMKQTDSHIIFKAEIPNDLQGTLSIPNFGDIEQIVPVQISTKRTSGNTPLIIAEVMLPEIIIDGNKITQNQESIREIKLPEVPTDRYPLNLNVNGGKSFPIYNNNQMRTVAFSINITNSLTITDNNENPISRIIFAPNYLTALTDNPVQTNITSDAKIIEVRIPKIADSNHSFTPLLSKPPSIDNCDNFRPGTFDGKTNENGITLMSQNADACTAFFAEGLTHNQGYAIFIDSEHVSGQAPKFWLENIDSQNIPIESYLSEKRETVESSFVLSPMEEFGSSYAFHFDNISIGRGETENIIKSLKVYPIFYNYLKSMQIKTPDAIPLAGTVDNKGLTVNHPNESLYVVDLSTSKIQEQRTMALSQAYDQGWSAYKITNSKWQIINSLKIAFPFIFGEKIEDHVMVNNWQNGWILKEQQADSNKQQVVIVYLPQYLQYAGFAFLIGSFLTLTVKIRQNKIK